MDSFPRWCHHLSAGVRSTGGCSRAAQRGGPLPRRNALRRLLPKLDPEPSNLTFGRCCLTRCRIRRVSKTAKEPCHEYDGDDGGAQKKERDRPPDCFIVSRQDRIGFLPSLSNHDEGRHGHIVPRQFRPWTVTSTIPPRHRRTTGRQGRRRTPPSPSARNDAPDDVANGSQLEAQRRGLLAEGATATPTSLWRWRVKLFLRDQFSQA